MSIALLISLMVLGAVIFARGLFPRKPTLAERLGSYSTESSVPISKLPIRSVWGAVSVAVVRRLEGSMFDEMSSDVAVVGNDVESHAVSQMNLVASVSILVPSVGVVLGLVNSAFMLSVLALAGGTLAYLIGREDLKKKAAARRDEFEESLTGFLSLVATSVAGGSGINSAMRDAAAIGDSWCFDHLRQSMRDSAVHGDQPWAGFESLARQLRIDPLLELSYALSLAGTSGVRLTETLRARANSANQEMLSAAHTKAEKSGESMNLVVGAMMIGLVGFIGYPAVVSLLSI